MSAALETWREALALGVRTGLLPAEVAASVDEDLAATPPSELTPALVGFWVDLDEAQVAELLRSASGAPTVGPSAGVDDSGVDTTASGTGAATRPPTDDAGLKALAPGQRLGEFVLSRPLGAGGMGRVFQARQVSLARDVALKVLSPQLAADPEWQKRFVREAHSLAAVQHPRVVQCFLVGQADGLHHLAMELMTGGDAWALLKAAPDGRLDERRALELTRDAAEGLVALERAGLIHRDLKPQNLFLDAEGRAKLGDLGLARQSSGGDRMTLTGVAMGTLPFMAPEQLDGSAEVDIRADLYALGATLVTFLTGKPPAVNSGPPGALAASPRTSAFARRAMAKDPARRYPDAAAALTALAEALAGLDGGRSSGRTGPTATPTVKAPPRARAQATARADSRRPGRLLPMLLLPPLVLAGLSAWRAVRSQPPSPAPSRPVGAAPELAAAADPQLGPDGVADPDAEPERATEPASWPEPPASPAAAVRPEQPRAPAPLTGLPRAGAAPLREVEPGLYRVEPDPNQAWHRAAAFDREARRLPVAVRWTVAATATRDSGPLADWERGHGFSDRAGVFYELGLRTDNREIDAANQLGPAWWVSLSVQTSGRVHGMVRQINRDRPAGTDLTAVPQPNLPRVPGIDVVDRFALDPDPDHPLVLDLDADDDGWRLVVRQADIVLWDGAAAWSDSRHAPISDELSGSVYLWSHLGNFSSGAGTGTVQVAVRDAPD